MSDRVALPLARGLGRTVSYYLRSQWAWIRIGSERAGSSGRRGCLRKAQEHKIDRAQDCSSNAQKAIPKGCLSKPKREYNTYEEFGELGLEGLYEDAGGVRVRQHVNPLTHNLQKVVTVSDWSGVFADPEKPLFIDLGSGSGRFMLLKAMQNTEYNFLGVEIREKLVKRANEWAELVNLQHNVHFIFANVNTSLQPLIANYPGTTDVIAIQFADPHFKKRHRKRRLVQPRLVDDVYRCLKPRGRVFIQTDVLDLALWMRQVFAQYGGDKFRPISGFGHKIPQAEYRADGIEGPVDDGLAEGAEMGFFWGWHEENPMGVPTEREIQTIRSGLPVYRIFLEKIE